MNKALFASIQRIFALFMIAVFTAGSFPIGAIKVFADEINTTDSAPVVTEAPAPEAQPEVAVPEVENTTEQVTEPTSDTTNQNDVTPETTEAPKTTETTDTTTVDQSTDVNNPVETKDAPAPTTLGDALSSVAETVDQALNAVTYENISTDSRYSSNDGNFGVTFSQLPEGTHTVTIKKITLTPEEVAATGSLDATAYDVTSDMTDGTFKYDLSLPVPANTDGQDLQVKYAETREELTTNTAAIAPADVTVSGDTVTAEDVNHFTIFLVTSGVDNPGATPLNAGQITSLQSSDNSRLNKIWRNTFGTRSEEFSFGSSYPVNSSILSATVRIELQRSALVDAAQLEYWNGSAYDTASPENILPSSSGVDQTFTFNVPTNYINTPAKVNAFKVRVRASGSSAVLCAAPINGCTTDIDYLRLQVVTGDTPANTFPADQANVSTASAGFTYTWSAVPYATTYEFERCSINPGTNDCAVAGGTVLNSVTGLATPSLTVGVGYTEALNAYWHVRTVFNDGQVSPWSAPFKLTIDNTAPVITYTPNPATPDGANGWYITAVPIDFSCADAGSVQSGIATDVTGDTTFNEGAGQTASSGAGTCVDNAGNIATPVTTAAFNVDLTNPTISAARDVGPNGNGWNNTAVTVTFTCSDATSGVDTCTSPETFSSEGTGMSSVGTVVDFSGRTATVTETPINIDLSAPAIALNTRTPANGNGWNNTAVTVTWTCDASISGLDSGLSTLTQTLSSEGAAQSTTGTCTDLAGNVSTDNQTGINIDLTAPIITFTGRTTPNGFNWNNTNVDVNWSCSDALSGVVSGTLLNTLTTNAADQTSTGTCADLADNTASDTQVNIDIDKVNPTLSIIAPADDAHVSPTFNTNGTASDALSGIRDVRVQFRNEIGNALVATFFATYDSGTDTWTLPVAAGDLADGYYRVNVRSRDYAGNTRTRINRRIYVDRIAPVITILGSNPATHEALSTYTDAGATSLDNIDGDLTAGIVTTNNVNQNVIGTYTVDYSSTDTAGNTGTASRTVNVVDTTIPVISLLGADPVTIEVHTPYVDAGATALDNYDGDVTASIVTVNPVNKDIVADYVVTYDVADSSGNNAVQVTRTVHVVDTTAPVITLNGGDMTITAPTGYSEPGYTAIDNYDGDITGSVVVTGTVNTNVAGTYTLSYNVTDAHGNVATTRTRVVTVRPSQNGPIDGTAPSTGFVPGAQGGPSSNGGGGGGGSVLGAFTGPNGSFFGGGFTPFQKLTGPLEAPKIGTPSNGSSNGGGTVLGASKFIFTKNLRQGMKIADVSELQKRLVSEGFLSADSVTGYYGVKTVAAVKSYQKAHVILVTGSVGPLTRAELNK